MGEKGNVLAGLLLPLLGTTMGSAAVFVLRRAIGETVQKAMLGFASGVMLAASVWSLLLPAIDLAEKRGCVPWLPAAGGFLAGALFLLALDKLIPHLHPGARSPEGKRSGLSRSFMLILAVTLHNVPEGMAVGVVLAGMRSGEAGITPAAALALALGIAVQNFPEGAIISLPLTGGGMKRGKAFLLGFLSGVVEPVGAVLTLLLTRLISPVLPGILSFAAGAMLYVVVEELIPESQSGGDSDAGTVSAVLGFAVMMLLDVAMG